MCGLTEHAAGHECEAVHALPRTFEGPGVDPIALDAVDEVVVTRSLSASLAS